MSLLHITGSVSFTELATKIITAMVSLTLSSAVDVFEYFPAWNQIGSQRKVACPLDSF